jgi:hypothetical protein
MTTLVQEIEFLKDHFSKQRDKLDFLDQLLQARLAIARAQEFGGVTSYDDDKKLREVEAILAQMYQTHYDEFRNQENEE